MQEGQPTDTDKEDGLKLECDHAAMRGLWLFKSGQAIGDVPVADKTCRALAVSYRDGLWFDFGQDSDASVALFWICPPGVMFEAGVEIRELRVGLDFGFGQNDDIWVFCFEIEFKALLVASLDAGNIPSGQTELHTFHFEGHSQRDWQGGVVGQVWVQWPERFFLGRFADLRRVVFATVTGRVTLSLLRWHLMGV